MAQDDSQRPETIRLKPDAASASDTRPLPNLSVLADRYELRNPLGRGGMGEVWRCHDRITGEEIALKLLHPALIHDEREIERFRRELKLARKVTHPNICRVFDFGSAEGVHFFTMELVEGKTLREQLKLAPLDPDWALTLLVQIFQGVFAAHAQGVVHGDLKPENVVLRRDGTAVVVDFGVARQLTNPPGQIISIAGTPQYMAPERLRGQPFDVQSDVFTLGLLARELLTGKLPADTDPSAPLSVPAWPQEVTHAIDEVLRRATAQKQENRYGSVGELGAALIAARLIGPAASSAETPAELRDALGLFNMMRRYTPAPMPVVGRDADATPEPRRILTPAGIVAASAPLRTPSMPMLRAAGGSTRDAASTADDAQSGVALGVAALDGVALTPGPGANVPALLGNRRFRLLIALLGVLGLAFASALAVYVRPRPVSPAPATAAEDFPAALLPFANGTNDSQRDTLTAAAASAVRQRLRRMNVRIIDTGSGSDDKELQSSAFARGAALVLRGRLTSAGPRVRLVITYHTPTGPLATHTTVDGLPGEHWPLGELARSVAAEYVRLRRQDLRQRRAAHVSPPAARRLLEQFLAHEPGGGASELELRSALNTLNQALDAAPQAVPLLVERSELLSQPALQNEKGFSDDALRDVERALQLDPADVPALAQRCHLLAMSLGRNDAATDQDFALAFQACERALVADVRLGEAHFALGMLSDLSCDAEGAIASLERALDFDPSKERRVLAYLTELSAQMHRIDAADKFSQWLLDSTLQESQTDKPVRLRALLLRAAMLLLTRAETSRQRAGTLFSDLLKDIDETTSKEEGHLIEAAALRGALATVSGQDPRMPQWRMRLDILEGKFRTDPGLKGIATRLASYYQWTEPAAAVAWIERAGEPQRCDDVLKHALYYHQAGHNDKAARVLKLCHPQQQWQRTCMARIRELINPGSTN